MIKIKRVVTVLCFLSLLLGSNSLVFANLDEVQAGLLDSHTLALRWDNVESFPEWVGGEEPIYSFKWHFDQLNLAPGQESVVYLKPYQFLRLYNPELSLRSNDFLVALSNSSGLAVEAPLHSTSDSHSLVLKNHSSRAQWVHIQRPENADKTVAIGMFVSREETLPELAPYRKSIFLTGPWVLLKGKNYQLPEIYWPIKPNQASSFEVQGPTRLLLKSRLTYEYNAAELLQNYRVAVTIDDLKTKWLHFSLGAESEHTVRVNGSLKVVSREGRYYLEVPKGRHTISLVPDRFVYLQVLEQEIDDYLFPSLNRLNRPSNQTRKSNLFPPLLFPSVTQIAEQAETLAKNNTYREISLLSTNVLAKAALQRPDFPPAKELAEKLLGQHTFYRDLFPSRKVSNRDQAISYFIRSKLKFSELYSVDTVLAEQHIGAAIKQLGQGVFNDIPAGKKAMQYRLPKRVSRSQLQIIVDKKNCQSRVFWLQYDQQPALKLRLYCPGLLPQGAQQLSLAESGLLQIQDSSEGAVEVTLSRAFAKYSKPGRLIDVANFELALPANVKKVSLWHNETEPLSVAVQYRADKYFHLSEHSYLSRLRQSKKSRLKKLFKQALNKGFIAGKVSENDAELLNEYQFLLRLILSEARLYQSLAAEKQTAPLMLKPDKYLKKKESKAKLSEQRGLWKEALGYWQKVVYASNGKRRDLAQLSQANALKQLGEDFLAKQLWRYLSVHAHKAVAEQSIQHLITFYEEQKDNRALQTLSAAMFVQWPEKTNKPILLFNSFIKNQKYREALLLGQLFLSDIPIDELLYVAYQLKWWETFDFYLGQLPSAKQAFWLGMREQNEGDYLTALKTWDTDETREWKKYLQEGLDLSALISTDSPSNEKQYIVPRYQAWLDWQQRYPGRKRWKNAQEIVKDYMGSDTYYSIERGVYDTAFRATVEKPVHLRVVGPMKLNLHIRALHTSNDMSSRLNGWITIKDNQEHLVTPFTNSTVVEGINLSGDTEDRVGRKLIIEYQVGEGSHEIDIFSDQANLSVQVEKEAPAFPLTVMPELNLDNFNALNAPLALFPKAKHCFFSDAAILMKVGTATTRAINGCHHQYLQQRLFSVLGAEQLPLAASSTLAVSSDLSEGSAGTEKNLKQAQLAMMRYLLQIESAVAEEIKKSSLALAEQLFFQYPDDPYIKAFWLRISRSTEWQKIANITSSAGVQFAAIKGWQPESTTLEIRKQLIEPIREGEHVLHGDKVLVFSMYNTSAVELNTKLRRLNLPFLKKHKIKIFYQLDEGERHSIELTSRGIESLFLSIPSGEHQLKFYLFQPLPNQFVALQFDDQVHDLSLQQERVYSVSTEKQPIQVYIEGPTVLRIDEWIKGNSHSRYRAVKKFGWQKIFIPPTKGRGESLFRIRQRVFLTEEKEVSNQVTKRALVPIPASGIEPELINKVPEITLYDGFELGAQEDGTWTLGLDFQRRNNFLEDRNSYTEQFAQLRVEHRYYDEALQGYWFSQGLARYREQGGPTFGLRETFYWQPKAWPVNTKLNTQFFVQALDGGAEWSGKIDVSFYKALRLTPKTTLTPKLSFFKQFLSLTPESEKVQNWIANNQLDQLDQDVYSAYKADHLHGMNAAFTLRHRPWLDTLWVAKFRMASNENFNIFEPDNIGLQAQWKQYLGGVQLEAAYGVIFYQKDSDRRISSSRKQLKLKVSWNSWLVKQNRLELAVQYMYDIDRNEHLPLLSMMFHFGEGRGYRDFRPNELNFLPLMQQRIPNEQNNRIEKNYN